MLYRPLLVGAAGLAGWFFIWLIAPLEIAFPLRTNTMVFIALSYFFFAVGCLWAEHSQVDIKALLQQSRPWQGELLSGFFWLSFIVGAAAMGLRFFDRVVIRGVSYTADADQVRDTLSSTDFSGASAVASVIMPFCFIPLILLLASKWRPQHWFKLMLAGILFCLPMLESLAQASRSIMLLTIVMAFFSVCLIKFDGQVFHRRLILPTVLGIFLTLAASTVIFSSRLESYGRNLDESVVNSAYAAAFTLNSNAKAGLSSPNPIEEEYYRAILPNSMYYLSGIYEFDLALNRPDEQVFGYGAYIFYPYSRVLALALGTESASIFEEDELIYRTGVFTSFFGPLWVDFGYAMFPIMILIGFVIQRLSPMVAAGQINILPLYLFCLVVVFYMPVFNFLVSGFGFFILHGFAIFAIFSSFSSETAGNTNGTAANGHGGMRPIVD
ncbi:oligosaccharide repeat unit polymerase [Sphingopyxis sp.]|jgi:oligosaccharide repeat unit polymerase|uniref:oligosaccharide repeat unit polymerase n=1 Tax=Sphingopyxis sp. TaxID=1908224 RepID=UPI002DE2646A|nr:oligosaccharide repeat unit polymerase [Sphingopyxis sp.]